LKDSYLKHVYTRRNRVRKSKRVNKTEITQPKNLWVGPQQNFTEKSLSRVTVTQLNPSSDSGGVVANKVSVLAPVNIPLVVESTPVTLMTSQPILNTTKSVVSSVPINSQQTLIKDPSPPKRLTPPLKSLSPLKTGHLNGPLTLSLSPSPPVEPKGRIGRSWSSLVAVKATTQTTRQVDSDSSTREKVSPPPTNCPKPNPVESKPKPKSDIERDRELWIERRTKLESLGVDLSVITLGRKEVDPWPISVFCGSKGGKNLYAVWRGVKIGVFQGWDVCNALVKNFKGAGFKKVLSDVEAVELLEKYLLHKGGG